MMEGQKVVKVFTHEQKALAGFRQLNDQLKDSANKANSFANIMMPVNAQLGNISYAVCALAGAAMAVSGMGGTTLGTVVAFLSLNKASTCPSVRCPCRPTASSWLWPVPSVSSR